MEQRIYAIYITLICQWEAIFDYSIAAQSKNSSNKNIAFIKKLIQWQLDNKLQDFCFKTINLLNIKLFIFIDGFFINNKNQSF